MPAALKPDFNESTFQLLYLREMLEPFLRSNRERNVSIPTLRSERRLGYDAEIRKGEGYSLFFQFKLAELRSVIPRQLKAARIAAPFWHFWIHSKEQQNKMFQLRKNGEQAYYVIPRLLYQADLMRVAGRGTLRKNSARIDPSNSRRVTHAKHRYTVDFRNNRRFHSEPVTLEDTRYNGYESAILEGQIEPRTTPQLLRAASFGEVSAAGALASADAGSKRGNEAFWSVVETLRSEEIDWLLIIKK